MLFYLVMGGLFTVYATDLLGLVIISAIARARELQAATAKKRQRKREARNRAAAEPKAATFAYGNEGMVAVSMPAIKITKLEKSGEGEAPDLAASTESHLSTPEAPPCPEPKERLANTLSNVSSYMDLVRDEAPSAPPANTSATPFATELSAQDDAPIRPCTPPTATSEESTSGEVATADLPNSNQKLTVDSPLHAIEPVAPVPVVPSPASTTPTHTKPYGWGFGSGAARASSQSLKHSGGSGVSLPSSGGSGISADMVISAELVIPALQQGKGKGSKDKIKPQLSFSDGVGSLEAGTDLIWPLPVDQYPLVLIQVPMFNEEAHAAIIIHRCCAIAWPRTRLLIQVLDDSTKEHIRQLVDEAALACMEKGHPVQVLRRTNRQGYKAGAMVAGLEHVAPMGFKYCAIFDADFEPPADFLLETIGPLESDNVLGFVQTRWVNPHKSFLTWAQKVNLGFHFDVEQRARSYMNWFFNFNGTAGVWRIQAIESAGGWETDTVVEDMDLSLRAYLAGWRGLYLPHVSCVNEVPDDLSTYKTQQYRWLCGPMQILSKAFMTIWRAKNVAFMLRMNCYWFFARYVVFGIITLAVLVVPPVALWLDPWVWHWPEIFFCVSINFALAVYLYVTPWSIAYMLFSVATGYFKAWAMLGGLMGSKKSKSWKVTAKKGSQTESGSVPITRRIKDTFDRLGTPYGLEMALSFYYAVVSGLAFAGVGLAGPSWLMGAYTALMAIIFFVISFGDAFL